VLDHHAVQYTGRKLHVKISYIFSNNGYTSYVVSCLIWYISVVLSC
jgi:hypothetical protein